MQDTDNYPDPHLLTPISGFPQHQPSMPRYLFELLIS
jgi:hypothetical protein